MRKIIAAVLVVFMCFALYSCGNEQDEGDGGIPEGQEIYDVVPMVPVGDRDYLMSTNTISLLTPPEGFVYAGKIEKGMYKDCEYYTNDAEPLWIYVRAQANAADKEAEPVYKYFRFVDTDICGKEYICVDGVLYVSGWSADHERNARDNIFGDIRIEGELPKGFESIGRAEFSGFDTIPEGKLSSNTGSEEVFMNKNDNSVLLIKTVWRTYGNVRHEGFDVYVIE